MEMVNGHAPYGFLVHAKEMFIESQFKKYTYKVTNL